MGAPTLIATVHSAGGGPSRRSGAHPHLEGPQVARLLRRAAYGPWAAQIATRRVVPAERSAAAIGLPTYRKCQGS